MQTIPTGVLENRSRYLHKNAEVIINRIFSDDLYGWNKIDTPHSFLNRNIIRTLPVIFGYRLVANKL